MTLADIEVYIGVIVDKDDPLNLGRVRVNIPGMFELWTDEAGKPILDPWTGDPIMELDDHPWVSPLSTGDYQGYSQLNAGNKVWVFHNVKNYYEYWYLPYFELNANTRALIDNKDLDIMVSRLGNEGDAQMYYSKADGFTTKISDSKLNLSSAGQLEGNVKSIKIDAPDGVEINGGKEPAVLGAQLQSLLKDLAGNLTELSTIAAANWPTAPLASGLIKMSSAISSKINDITSTTVKIS